MSSSKKMTHFILDTNRPPVLSAQERVDISALVALPDELIDFSDQPALTEEQIARAQRAKPMFRPTKTSTSVRLDSDILAWLKGGGKGWQTRINSILRGEMLRAREK